MTTPPNITTRSAVESYARAGKLRPVGDEAGFMSVQGVAATGCGAGATPLARIPIVGAALGRWIAKPAAHTRIAATSKTQPALVYGRLGLWARSPLPDRSRRVPSTSGC